MAGYHKSVLLGEVLEALKVEKGKWYLDCTLGDGGYSLEILKLGGKVAGIDVDSEATERASRRLRGFGVFRLIQGNFRDIKSLVLQTELKDLEFAGAIFDLGVSSLQLESPARGFSFLKEGPLDMRMDPALNIRALDLINILSRKELYELFKTLGEEKYSKRLADALVSARQVRQLITTTQLAEEVEKAVGRKEKIHPATRVFQALRIAVNDELHALREGLSQVIDLIKDGHILVISFHSLEDRIVKLAFREWESQSLGEVVNKKPIAPSDQERTENPRSRSAKLRVFKRL